MRRQAILACLMALGLLVPAFLHAEHTRFWRQSEFSDFEKGTAKGVAIRSDGQLTPAPKFVAFADPNLAYLWQLKLDSHGRLYAAGGPDAKVVRFDEAGKAATVFESSELAAQAIAFDANDNLYVGTSPDGKVYKVTPDGQKTTFFETKTKYIWALAFDAPGTLFVATGDKGEIFEVAPDGKGRLFYQTDERHARSLAFDAKGNLLVGTEPNGLILRIELAKKAGDTLPAAGPAYVLYETSKKEVTSLLTDPSGNLYASSIGEKPRAPGAAQPGQIIVTPQPQPQPAVSTQGITLSQSTTPLMNAIQYPFFTAAGGGGAEVVKIAEDGTPESLWTSREDLVFSMGMNASGKLLLGTGDKGEVIELEGNRVYSTVAKTASAQVTSLAAGPGGKLFVATSNPGNVFALGPGYDSNGSFESDSFDARIFSHWGRLAWWGENGATTGKVEFYVRCGNTSTPGKNWSAWTGPYKNAAGDTVNCPASRFAQWKAVFLETDGGAPGISWVSLAYLPENVAPEIDDIVVQDPGIRVQGFAAAPAGPGIASPVQLRMPQRANSSFTLGGGAVVVSPESISQPAKVDIPPQGFQEKGFQSVLWGAHDDNDDDLVYTIYYRGEGETNWRLLKDKITQKYYSWDSTSMPDGAYYLKIVASDAPSNPAGRALTAERESDRFVVANTPPRVADFKAAAHEDGADISFSALGSSGSIARAEYSVDSADWQVVFPVGLLSDAPKESYAFKLTGLSSGEHTIAVRISDQYENSAAAKVTFDVPAHASR